MPQRTVPPAARAFTLIEVLVVVAIIALLVSILLPSLASAKEQAKTTVCQSYIRSIAIAFATFSAEHKGRLPGVRNQKDPQTQEQLDWLGLWDGTATTLPTQPRAGAIWKYLGRQKEAYICPSDEKIRYNKPIYPVTHSYSFQTMLSGANVEWLTGAHRLKSMPYNVDDHTGAVTPLVPFDGVPMLVEENFQYYDPTKGINTNAAFDGGWANNDALGDRHQRKAGSGYASMAFVDTHVGKVQLPAGNQMYPAGRVSPSVPDGMFFEARDLCIRTKSKWISGRSFDEVEGKYGSILSCSAAKDRDVKHLGDPTP